MIDKTTFIQTLLGGMDPSVFLVYFLVALAGMFVKFLVDVSRSIQTDSETPDHFTWKHFFSPSAVIRWVIDLILLPLVLAQAPDFFDQQISVKLSLLIGIGIDGVATIIVGSGRTVFKKVKG